MDWTRLCVDTDRETAFVQLVDDHHLGVLITAVGQGPSENAADVGLVLPGPPPRVAAALTADPQRPTARLHLLGKSRVAVDDGDHYRQLRDVPHALRGSLVVTRGRVTRAELWIADRRNVTAAIAGAIVEYGREPGDRALRHQAAQTAPRTPTRTAAGRDPAGNRGCDRSGRQEGEEDLRKSPVRLSGFPGHVQ